MPGRFAPAFFYPLAAGIAMALPAPAAAQGQPSAQMPPSMRPVPDQLEMSKLIWSTLLAVDHANRSGNYSVLRDMSAQGFQINNDAARLAQIFTNLREQRIDLANSLLVPPTYYEPPRQVQAGVFEVKGLFQIRPTAIQFHLFYQWEQGRWKLFGIDIQPLSMIEAMPGPPVPPQQDRRRR